MRLRVFISCFLLVVYALTLGHAAIPHCHQENEPIKEFCQADVKEHNQNHNHHDHKLPHHDQNQHDNQYINVNNTIGQFIVLVAVACPTQNFDLVTPCREIKKEYNCYFPQKVPIQLSNAVPLRAPPTV